jgi:hypothetical protein
VSTAHAPAPPAEAPRDDAIVRDIGRVVQRMAERTKDEEHYLPHPIAVAMAEAIRGGNLTDGDGSFSAAEHGWQVVMSKRQGHFALLEVADLRRGLTLAPDRVLRVLHAHDVLASYPGEAVQGEVAEGVVSGLLGIDDSSSRLLLRKAGFGEPQTPEAMVPKRALLEWLAALP